MREVLVDFITTLDGYASGEGWPGFWGLEGPEYLAWLTSKPEVTYLMGANTYRLMSGFAGGEVPPRARRSSPRRRRAPSTTHQGAEARVLEHAGGAAGVGQLDARPGRRGGGGAGMKAEGEGILSTLGSLTLARSLLVGGVVDRFRVVMFPVITGATGEERIDDGYPDVALEMTDHATFDGGIQLVQYRPRVLDRPPLATA